MKRLCMIATGGTIASERGVDGLRPALNGKALLALVPELQGIGEIDCREILQLDSSNLLPQHWQQMARKVAELYDRYDGFVITHGTDTMAYTAAALYYMLEHTEKPVVITGSQLPIEQTGTDAKRNLFLAFTVAASGHRGVYLAFGGKVLWGNAVKKMYTEEFAAFQSINCTEAGVMDEGILRWNGPERPAGKFVLQEVLDDKVCVLKLTPGLAPEIMRLLTDAGYHAIIIEGYGAGGVPTQDSPKNFLPGMEYAVQHGVVVVCTTQCIYNGAHLDRYEIGVLAERYGAISGGDLPTDALVPLLMLLLGRKAALAEIRAVLQAGFME